MNLVPRLPAHAGPAIDQFLRHHARGPGVDGVVLELVVEAHVMHLLEDVVTVGACLDGQVTASTDGKPYCLSVTSASHEAMLGRRIGGLQAALTCRVASVRRERHARSLRRVWHHRVK